MFKYLLLKSIYDLSDVDVVERSKYDMSFKYFLDMAPEDEVINPSSLTKFRKLRLKDMNLLDMLIAKTVQLALDKGIIKSKSIIVDATHTKSRYNSKTPRQVLQEQSKKLRRAIYEIDETMGESFPAKNTEDSLEKELEYCKQLISVIKEKEELCSYPKVQEKLNLLEESVSDDMQHLETSKDAYAKTGHKTADTSFFGYKTHIAMTEERIITAATITSGEKTDGKELPELVRIGAIYKLEEGLKTLSPEERLKERKSSIRPLVEKYFAWIKEVLASGAVLPKSETAKGLKYSINQEEYLKVFLTDGEVPIDDSASERALRNFTIGRKNWVTINTIRGAQASAIIYSITETARANNLNVYYYIKHLLTEIPRLVDKNENISQSILDPLMPWSKSLPADCYSKRRN